MGRRLADVWTVLDGSAAAEAQLGQPVNPKQLSVAPKATAVNAERNKSQQVAGNLGRDERVLCGSIAKHVDGSVLKLYLFFIVNSRFSDFHLIIIL